jgi:uncharacterized membrane protein YgcG
MRASTWYRRRWLYIPVLVGLSLAAPLGIAAALFAVFGDVFWIWAALAFFGQVPGLVAWILYRNWDEGRRRWFPVAATLYTLAVVTPPCVAAVMLEVLTIGELQLIEGFTTGFTIMVILGLGSSGSNSRSSGSRKSSPSSSSRSSSSGGFRGGGASGRW